VEKDEKWDCKKYIETMYVGSPESICKKGVERKQEMK
jgi:hypothetical protein